ncbi:MAG: TraB/GumN family protein [Cytophagales bacterium]|nr:MAG: TraB/GumN family protein [Cytophagales bacterium]TAF62101.1 MAG: TraB/GumN family protein [Cytophagales bacterium]
MLRISSIKFWLTFGLAVSLFSFVCKDTPKNEDGKSLLWQISGNGLTKPSYLFGTIHLICEKDMVISEPLKKAFAESEEICLELDMDDPQMAMGMLKDMALPQGQTLLTLLGKKKHKKLSDYFAKELKMDLSLFEKQKPFFIQAIIMKNMLSCQVGGYEMTFMGMAKEQSKNIVGVEKIEDQMAAVNAMPVKEQAESLLAMVEEQKKYSEMLAKMVSLYKSEDVTALYEFTQKPVVGKKMDEKAFLINRNVKWIPEMEAMSKEKSMFYAVGAAHLGGEQGVINLLRKQGYTVTPLK